MERATLARPYADAVAKLAAESDAWTAWSERLALLDMVLADPQIRALAENPGVSSDRLVEVILAVCGERIGAEGANLLGVLAENKRLALLPEIITLFEAEKAAREGVLEAHFTTAFELSAEQMSALVARLESRFSRKIAASQSVDSALIGGVVIQVGDEVMDASVRGGLQSLAVTLKA
ncbi:MAG: F-type H+-transporting ATPase subunit delta [bacterium]|nr:MAG: F-type H+-transporting ATPase subunit delta [bacterium]KAF0149289.1 MAG: F-type H+-transporting ATPase subunit delta [bacterium]KAF0169811.1 MAG: F-type H+-transporting ATPase subunit delta [bacterium]TXT22735.1 MAG: F-type H+-transporting ATPase subunit delta [bacterium]